MELCTEDVKSNPQSSPKHGGKTEASCDKKDHQLEIEKGIVCPLNKEKNWQMLNGKLIFELYVSSLN